MRHVLITTMALLAAAPAPIDASEISEEAKIAALKLGYILNGDSMVRPPELGSIDLTPFIMPRPMPNTAPTSETIEPPRPPRRP